MNSTDLQQRSGNCPDLEDLAALLDDMVEEEERQHLLGHLAECQDCYELYAETARFKIDDQIGGENATVAATLPERAPAGRFHGKTPAWAGLAAAAVLVLAAGIPVYRSFAIPPTFETAELLPTGGGGGSKAWTEPKMRGPAGGSAVAAERRERAFQLGVQVTNLRAALLAGDREQAAWAAQLLHQLVGQAAFADDLVETYKALQTDLQKGSSFPDLLVRTQEAEAQLRETLFDDAFYLDFGKWVEAGYLSAQTQDPQFFTNPEVRRFARALPWQDDQQVDVEAQKEVESIRKSLGRSDLDGSEYQEIRARFERILQIYYVGGRPEAESD